MYKYIATYEDFNDEKQTETCYFNLTATELMRHSDMLEDMLKIIQRKDPNPKDVMLFVDTLVKLSYGEKSEDGKRFLKSAERTEAFMSSPVYDAFLFDLMDNPDKTLEFIERMIPAEVAQRAKKLMDEENKPTPVQPVN